MTWYVYDRRLVAAGTLSLALILLVLGARGVGIMLLVLFAGLLTVGAHANAIAKSRPATDLATSTWELLVVIPSIIVTAGVLLDISLGGGKSALTELNQIFETAVPYPLELLVVGIMTASALAGLAYRKWRLHRTKRESSRLRSDAASNRQISPM